VVFKIWWRGLLLDLFFLEAADSLVEFREEEVALRFALVGVWRRLYNRMCEFRL
jgi:hypothetical protein